MNLLKKIIEWWNAPQKPKHCKIHDCDYMEHGYEGRIDCPKCRKEQRDNCLKRFENHKLEQVKSTFPAKYENDKVVLCPIHDFPRYSASSFKKYEELKENCPVCRINYEDHQRIQPSNLGK